MAAILGASIDVAHALFMAVWVLALPLLFWHRWPRLTRAYAIYAIAFVVMNQLSFALLGECFLTTLARVCWKSSGDAGAAPDEWFTVRLAQVVFRLTPSHRAVKLLSEALILVTAVGVVFRGVMARRRTRSVGRPLRA